MTVGVEDLIRTARGAGIISAQSFITALIGTILFIFIARSITQVEMGIYGVLYLILGIAGRIGVLGLDYGATRYIPYLRAKGKRAKSVQTAKRVITISILSAVVIVANLLIFSYPITEITLGTYAYVSLFQITAITIGILISMILS